MSSQSRLSAFARRCSAATPRRSSAWNERARADRDALLGAGLCAAAAVHELRVSVPNRPGVIAEIALALGDAGVNIVDMALSPSRGQPPGRRGAVDRRRASRPRTPRS